MAPFPLRILYEEPVSFIIHPDVPDPIDKLNESELRQVVREFRRDIHRREAMKVRADDALREYRDLVGYHKKRREESDTKRLAYHRRLQSVIGENKDLETRIEVMQSSVNKYAGWLKKRENEVAAYKKELERVRTGLEEERSRRRTAEAQLARVTEKKRWER